MWSMSPSGLEVELSEMGSRPMLVVLLALSFILTACEPRETESTPAALLGDPDKFDGKIVLVRGMVSDVGAARYPDGNVYPRFKLAYGGREVLVFSAAPLPAWQCQATVKGRFVKVNALGERGVIDATEVSCSSR